MHSKEHEILASAKTQLVQNMKKKEFVLSVSTLFHLLCSSNNQLNGRKLTTLKITLRNHERCNNFCKTQVKKIFS